MQLEQVEFQATNNFSGTFKDLQGQWTVLYFYPRDATPGCTVQGQNFRDNHAQFKALGATVLGVSRDDLKKHERFKAKQEFPFELISDPEEALCQKFDVMKMKNMFGKQVRGIVRSTFIIDPQGQVCCEWRKVNIDGHVDEVLNKLKQLTA